MELFLGERKVRESSLVIYALDARKRELHLKKPRAKKKNNKMNYKGYRKGVTLIVYLKERGKLYYLVVKRKLRWIGYGLVKGGKKKGEDYLDCAKRELREETGLKNAKIIDLKIIHKFEYPKRHQKVFRKQGFNSKCYAVLANGKKIKLNYEHSAYKWLKYSEALKILTFKDSKELLKRVDKKIKGFC
jgi:8-oxo-dGTP pyrophosphatase MutT (NUDIX family)